MRYPATAWEHAEVEQRRDVDGVLYTAAEFWEYYGSESDGVAYEMWSNAKHWDRRMTIEIKATTTIEDLLGLHEMHEPALNYIHVATVWHQLSVLSKDRLRRRWMLRNEAVLERLCVHTLHMMPRLEARGLSNISYSLAKAGLHGRSPWVELMGALGMAARPRLCEFTEQDLANTSWAFATAGHKDSELFDALAAEVRPRLGEFNEQALANMAWAFATLGCSDPKLFDALAAEARPRLCEFTEQALANMAWAFATLGRRDPKLFDALAAEARPRLCEFTEQALANTAWAFATLGRSDPKLFDALAAEARPRLGEFEAQHLANTAWAFATLGRSDAKLFDALAAEARPRLGEFNEQNLANTAWAFAAADARSDALFGGQTFIDACQRQRQSLLAEPRSLTQLDVWREWRDQCCAGGRSWPNLPEPLLEACKRGRAGRKRT